MKALILAAGFGKRLRPYTDIIPKAMIEVNGTPLLINALNHLVDAGIIDIGIVVGHMAEYIRKCIGTEWRGAKISYFENTHYLETNNIASLYKAVDFCNDDLLMLECDIYFEKEIIETLIMGQGDCTILVSPFNPNTMDGSVVRVDGDNATELILGKWQGKDFDYTGMKKTVNFYRFNKKFLQKYMILIQWYIENMGQNCYYEKILGIFMYLRECDIRILEVPENTWCEIDNAEDLARANKQFTESGLSSGH